MFSNQFEKHHGKGLYCSLCDTAADKHRHVCCCSFEKVHRAVIVSILHGLLVFETENPDRIHPFAEASLSHSLHGYVDFVSKMSSPTFS